MAKVLLCWGLGLFLLLHQQMTSNDVWFNWEQLFNQLNHETLILFCLAVGIALLVGKR